MINYKNLTLIGTSHISIESVKEVKEVILKLRPSIVALELDSKRFIALTSNEKRSLKLKDIFRLGATGFFFNLIGAFVEKKLGEYVGVAPGSEMKEAAKTAKKINAKIALIDQDISVTLKDLSKAITWKEKFRFLKDILKGIFSKKKEKIPFDLKKVPDKKIIDQLIKRIKKDYPNVYKVLIKNRNDVIAKNLNKLINIYSEDRIVAVVGAGHEEELIRLIRKKGI